jgi:hypothetical protein
MTGTTTPDSSRIAEDVIGAWRLVSYVVEDADGGNRTYPLGEDRRQTTGRPTHVGTRRGVRSPHEAAGSHRLF